MQPGLARDALARPAVGGDVLGPQRLAALPGLAHQADTRRVGQAARLLDEALERGARNAPGVAEPQQPRRLVHAEIPAAFPVVRLAYRTHRGDQGLRAVLRLRQATGYGMLQIEQQRLALARGDVLADAAITAEPARGVEHRFAADRQMALHAALVQPRELEIAERLVLLHARAVRSPAGGVRARRGELPAGLAEAVRPGHDGPVVARLLRRHQAGLGVALPAEVR